MAENVKQTLSNGQSAILAEIHFMVVQFLPFLVVYSLPMLIPCCPCFNFLFLVAHALISDSLLPMLCL
ncbi:hypothetical protein KJ032_26275 [Salmonella enterica subsp. enterica serovar Typhimurium]|nr:hypothetical protein [Salmonella enterica subsp. enterica serovar Typhimurium]